METVATLALKSRLKAHASVQTRVDCDALGLMAGRMRGVEISGAGWRSPLDLTAQSLQVSPAGASQRRFAADADAACCALQPQLRRGCGPERATP